MDAKNQKPNLHSEKIQSTSFLTWIISGLYLLPMVWFLLSRMGGYGGHETKPWLVPAVAAFTVSYGILMLLLWPHEKTLLGSTSSSSLHPYSVAHVLLTADSPPSSTKRGHRRCLSLCTRRRCRPFSKR